LGYALGSIPFGLLLTRATGAGDLRAIGSGNIGATNVLRTGRKGLAAATLLLDGGKGATAVLLARQIGHGAPLPVVIAGFAALIGHCYPVWLRFKGGKGVATMLGISFALDWRIGVASALVWAAMAWLTRISSAGGIASAVAAPVAALILLSLLPQPDWHGASDIISAGDWQRFSDTMLALRMRPALLDYAMALAVMALLVIWKHRANIARLLIGTEPRIGQKG
jgi:glycerol-3-phosphate acyltransferase PlsY